jgi:hypothetical protein
VRIISGWRLVERTFGGSLDTEGSGSHVSSLSAEGSGSHTTKCTGNVHFKKSKKVKMKKGKKKENNNIHFVYSAAQNFFTVGV